MDIHSFFGSTSTPSTSVSRQSSSSSEDDSDVESLGSTAPKKACTVHPQLPDPLWAEGCSDK